MLNVLMTPVTDKNKETKKIKEWKQIGWNIKNIRAEERVEESEIYCERKRIDGGLEKNMGMEPKCGWVFPFFEQWL